METALVILVVLLAVGFDFTNGFHDAANAIATSVSTRALTPKIALGMAAVMNFAGALLGVAVAETIAKKIVQLGQSGPRIELTVVLCALVGAIAWNLITWWFGLPSSSTHSLIGGLVGAGIASLGFGSVLWGNVMQKVVIPMVVSPFVGFGMAFLVMIAVLWIFRRANPWKATRRFRIAQTASAAAMALGHGLQDAQKTMGIIAMALFAYWHTGHPLPEWLVGIRCVDKAGATLAPPVGALCQAGEAAIDGIPLWVKLVAAAAISAGTATGGMRIMRTLGRRIIELDPARGFVAESVSSIVLYVAAFAPGLHVPVSTTHVITTAIMGVGATRRISAVRWGVAKSILVAWVMTIPAAAVVAMLVTVILRPLIGS